jgi:hypothetical protein
VNSGGDHWLGQEFGCAREHGYGLAALIGGGEAQARAAASPRSAGLARHRACGALLLPALSVHRLHIFAFLGKITIQDMFSRRCFVVFVWKSRGFWSCTESCRVAKS